MLGNVSLLIFFKPVLLYTTATHWNINWLWKQSMHLVIQDICVVIYFFCFCLCLSLFAMFQRLYFLRTGPNKKELAVALNDVLLLHFRATVFLARCVAGSKSPSLLRLPGCDQFAPTSPTQNPPNWIQETLQWLGPHLCPGTFFIIGRRLFPAKDYRCQ